MPGLKKEVNKLGNGKYDVVVAPCIQRYQDK